MEERLSRNTDVQEVPEERSEKELAALSYLWVFGLILLVARRANPFIQHHARRGTVLFALSLLLWPIAWLRYGEFAVMALSVFGFIQAATGNENRTPVLSEIADGTFGKKDLRHYYLKAKDGTIKVVKPDYVPTPMEMRKRAEAEVAVPQAKADSGELDERKLSGIVHRLIEDENEIHRLEGEVKRLEGELEAMKK